MDTGNGIARISGDIDFDSYFLFTRLGEKGLFEIGVRRDRIKTTDSVLTYSFDPYRQGQHFAEWATVPAP